MHKQYGKLLTFTAACAAVCLGHYWLDQVLRRELHGWYLYAHYHWWLR